MQDLREVVSVVRQRHPRAVSGLYQAFLCVITYECAVAVARYGPGRASNPCQHTHCEDPHPKPQICEFGAREEIDFGPLEVTIPNFILCPSTSTFIASFIVLIWGTNTLYIWSESLPGVVGAVAGGLLSVIFGGDWKLIRDTIQFVFPLSLCIVSVQNAIIIRPLLKWRGMNANKQMIASEEEQKQQKIRKMESALEAGMLGRPKQAIELEGKMTEEIPLQEIGSVETPEPLSYGSLN